MRRLVLSVASLLVAVLPFSGAAQDMEAVAAMRGIPMPAGYRELVSEHPDFFEFPNVWRGRSVAKVGGAAADPVSGVFPIIVIPALFSDSGTPVFTAEDIQRSLFDGPAPSGTITDFYRDASGGLLAVSGVTAPWVRTSITMADVVGTSAGIGPDSRVGEYLAEALSLADPGIDFGQFDNDGPDGIPNSGDDDGVVDAVTFEFNEVAGSCGGPAIWPHRAGLELWLGAPYTTGELQPDGTPVVVDGYIIQGTTDCSGTVLQTANVISHEFGHVLGLPDIYHPIDGIEPQNRRWVLGCWALMAAGAWGCDDSPGSAGTFGPTHFSPWSKDRLGWIDWIDVADALDQEYILGPAQTSRNALRIPMDDLGREFLVVEFRPRVGFDGFLPVSGVLVYHWDLGGDLRPDRGSGVPYAFSLEEADGRSDLLITRTRGGNRGEASDAWGVDGRVGPINSLSVPSTRRDAGNQASTVTIHSITLEGENARVRVTTVATPTLLGLGELPTPILAQAYEGRVRMAGGALPYTAVLPTGMPTKGLGVAVDGEQLVIGGVPAETGPVQLLVRLTDGLGSEAEVVLDLVIGPFVVSDDRLVQPFILSDEAPLTEAERNHLDAVGNSNGIFDIGDARAQLIRGG
ncbi:MAG: hypothetical protein BMS9Abin29_0037 [Gemmatimonadota bacterium]|nr:MAG: hypothetical protein BMS9Abin29_0037 [Gemmatimonadota bacterium]